MIGIMDKDISAYSIIEKIRTIYPKVDIYWYKENTIEEGINRLQEKGCKIIILPQDTPFQRDKYPEITFLDGKDLSIENSYNIETKELLEAISQGDELLVREILEHITIPKNQKIFLKNPKLRYIRPILEEVFSEEIIDSLDVLLNELKKIPLDNGSGKTILIK